MMTDEKYDNLLKILLAKYPQKKLLTRALMELLGLEREAVYRRLRKEVVFSVAELAKIASEWNLSLDEITGVNPGEISFRMRKMNYLDPSQEELNFLEFVTESMEKLKNLPTTEFMNICNKLPRQLVAGYHHLNQFYLFKWQYQYGNPDVPISFSQAVISEEKALLTARYYQATKNVPNSSFIWDHKLFENLISDIEYFYSIQLISPEEKELIKKDLYDFLDYMLEVATIGCYPETQNKVNLYVSQLNIDTNYSYTFTPEANICFIHVFEKYEIYTLNSEMTEDFRAWMQLKKKTSTQISEVDERNRIEFFVKQRQLVDSL